MPESFKHFSTAPSVRSEHDFNNCDLNDSCLPSDEDDSSQQASDSFVQIPESGYGCAGYESDIPWNDNRSDHTSEVAASDDSEIPFNGRPSDRTSDAADGDDERGSGSGHADLSAGSWNIHASGRQSMATNATAFDAPVVGAGADLNISSDTASDSTDEPAPLSRSLPTIPTTTTWSTPAMRRRVRTHSLELGGGTPPPSDRGNSSRGPGASGDHESERKPKAPPLQPAEEAVGGAEVHCMSDPDEQEDPQMRWLYDQTADQLSPLSRFLSRHHRRIILGLVVALLATSLTLGVTLLVAFVTPWFKSGGPESTVGFDALGLLQSQLTINWKVQQLAEDRLGTIHELNATVGRLRRELLAEKAQRESDASDRDDGRDVVVNVALGVATMLREEKSRLEEELGNATLRESEANETIRALETRIQELETTDRQDSATASAYETIYALEARIEELDSTDRSAKETIRALQIRIQELEIADWQRSGTASAYEENWHSNTRKDKAPEPEDDAPRCQAEPERESYSRGRGRRGQGKKNKAHKKHRKHQYKKRRHERYGAGDDSYASYQGKNARKRAHKTAPDYEREYHGEHSDVDYDQYRHHHQAEDAGSAEHVHSPKQDPSSENLGTYESRDGKRTFKFSYSTESSNDGSPSTTTTTSTNRKKLVAKGSPATILREMKKWSDDGEGGESLRKALAETERALRSMRL